MQNKKTINLAALVDTDDDNVHNKDDRECALEDMQWCTELLHMGVRARKPGVRRLRKNSLQKPLQRWGTSDSVFLANEIEECVQELRRTQAEDFVYGVLLLVPAGWGRDTRRWYHS